MMRAKKEKKEAEKKFLDAQKESDARERKRRKELEARYPMEDNELWKVCVFLLCYVYIYVIVCYCVCCVIVCVIVCCVIVCAIVLCVIVLYLYIYVMCYNRIIIV